MIAMHNLGTIVDGFGVHGSYFHYGLIIAMVGSAMLAFFYFWKKGRLDMDEEPKWQMMKNESVVKSGQEDE